MTGEEERIFTEAVRSLAAICNVPQFRCELFDENGKVGIVFAIGPNATVGPYYVGVGDGRCGPGGAAALLRCMAGLAQGGTPPKAFVSALRNAARLTFDTDEKFDKMFPSDI